MRGNPAHWRRSSRHLRAQMGTVNLRLVACGIVLFLGLVSVVLNAPAGVGASTPEAAALEQRREDCGDAMTRCLSMEGGLEEDCEDCVAECTQLAQAAEPGPGIDADVAEEYERIARATVSRCQEELDDLRLSSTSVAFAAGVSFGSV
ncbi:hypothetical protein MMPV_008991 [Pyropia vietnamensis]